MADKMMDRISKLLRTAESDSATDAERETAMDMATRLSQAHSIDLHLARMHAVKKEQVQVPERRSHKVAETHWAKGRSQVNKNSFFVDLFLEIARVYDLRCTISGTNVYVHAHGYPADHEIAERLFSILSVQMVSEADRELKAGANKRTVHEVKRRREEIPEDERAWGMDDGHGSWYDEEEGVIAYERTIARRNQDVWALKENPPPKHRLVDVYDDEGNPVYVDKQVSVVDGRTWRNDYYRGFISKIGRRLRSEKEQAMRDAGIDTRHLSKSEAGLALIDKAEQVAKSYDEEIERYVLQNGGKELGSYEGSGEAKSHLAHSQGQDAANRATTGSERDLREV